MPKIPSAFATSTGQLRGEFSAWVRGELRQAIGDKKLASRYVGHSIFLDRPRRLYSGWQAVVHRIAAKEFGLEVSISAADKAKIHIYFRKEIDRG